jgi:hypothetical protein
MAFAPALADFGHGSMMVNNVAARGKRPLLVLLVDWGNLPQEISAFHSPDYYEKLAFGDPTPPFSTSSPVNPASLCAYFRENSLSRFTYERVNLISLKMGHAPATAEERCKAALGKVDKNILLAQNDDFGSTLDDDELSVLIIENFADAAPDTARNEPFTLTFDFDPASPFQLQVAIRLAGGGPLTPFYQLAHELSHLLGTRDMYNMGPVPLDGNEMLTLMGAYSFTNDDQGIVHLDMWHKMQLGWAEPRRFTLKSIRSQSEVVRDDVADGAILLWDEVRRDSEYFIIERRSPAGSRWYDANFPGDGILIWRVQKATMNGPIIQNLPPPNLAAGVAGVWQVGQETPPLVWSDGSTTGVTIKVAAGPDGSALVSWGDPLTHQSSVRHQRLFYGGNGVDPVGGLTRQGIFYGVTLNGDLEWNSYKGIGAGAGDPLGLQAWHANTGNLIGRGFAHLKHVVGGGDGVILIVHPDGTLRWFGYEGMGEPDVTGTEGFLPNSGNTIHSGFGDVVRMFVAPRAGPLSSKMSIFAVHSDGLLRWYRYEGNGEHDPSGTLGWHPNSGNPVGQGWLGVRHAHASSNVFFVVTDDGLLRWYSYSGKGEADQSGTLGWHPNTGNPIGRGWGHMVHIFGGVTDLVDGFGHTVYAVNPAGELRWYHYKGNGEADSIGTAGWHHRSGNIIGTGW